MHSFPGSGFGMASLEAFYRRFFYCPVFLCHSPAADKNAAQRVRPTPRTTAETCFWSRRRPTCFQAALDAGVGLPGSGNASDEGEDSENDDGDSSLRFRSLVRNVSDSCSGLGQAIRKCSMIGGGVDAPGVFVNGGGMRGDGEGGAPRWVPDEEQEACMLCAKK